MQHKQQNYKRLLGAAAFAAAGFFQVFSAQSAGQPGKPDILTDGQSGPCDPQLGNADYVGGMDVNGQPVAAADLDKTAAPVPGQIQVPLKAKHGAAPVYVQADGKALAPLLNPPAACPAPPR